MTIPPDQIKLRKQGGQIRTQKGEDPSKVAERLTINDIVRFIVGSSVETVEDALRLGYDILKEYSYIARLHGYESIYDFIKDAVNFFLEWKDKLPHLIEQQKKMKAYISLIKPQVVRQIAELKKLDALRELMMISLISNAPKELVELWKREIENWYNEYVGKTVEISFGDIEHTFREIETAKGDDKGEGSGEAQEKS